MTLDLVRKIATATANGELDLSVNPQVIAGNKQFSGFIGVGVTATAPVHVRAGGTLARILVEHDSDGTGGIVLANNVNAGGTDKWWRIGVYASASTQFSIATVTDGAGSSPSEVLNILNTGAWTIGPSFGTNDIVHSMISNSTGKVELKVYSPNPSSTATTLSIRNSSGTAANDGMKFVHGGGVTKFQDLNSSTFVELDITNGGAMRLRPNTASSALTIFGYNGTSGGYAVSGGEGLVVGANLSGGTYFGILVVNGRGGGQATSDWYLRFTDSVTQRGGIQCSNSTTVAFIATSDARLKTDVSDLTGGLAMARALQPRNYTWKLDGSRDIGFLAQELKRVYPSAVAGDENGDPEKNPMGVDYGRITPVLAAAIKDLAVITDDHAAEIAALKARLAALESK